MKKLVNKYIYILIFFLVVINVLGYLNTVIEDLPILSSSKFSFLILKLIFGVIFIIVTIFDRKKIKFINNFLFVALSLISLLDYYSGIILFTIAVIANNHKKMSAQESEQEDSIIKHLVTPEKDDRS